MDKATEFTLKYLDILEGRVNISWSEQHQPVCIVDNIKRQDIQDLSDDLDALLRGQLSEEARHATVAYGKDHIQTIGFGHASNFDQFIKLGFLYGERLVLWDVIGCRLITESDATPKRKNLLAQAACNLLLLRPVAENGGVVILPYPTYWSELARQVEIELQNNGNKCAATLGLSMALAAIDSGLPLHPYTLSLGGLQASATKDVIGDGSAFYSTENYLFNAAITSLLRDSKLAYLQDISIAEFYKIVSQYGELNHALRKHFFPTLLGLSPQQSQKEIDHLIDNLVDLIDKRNRALANYVADGGDATLSFVLPTITTVLAGLSTIDALTTGSISLGLFSVLRKWLNTPEKNVIVQVFDDLKDVEMTLDLKIENPIETFNSDQIHIYPDIEDIYHTFMSFSWTEQRHYFLKELPPEVVDKLLRCLTPEDFEIIVNYRRFQEDYIGDYLGELWEIDKISFWEHIGKMFESEEGLLVYDLDAHIQVMCSNDMLTDVWIKLLNSLLVAHHEELADQAWHYPLETLKDIIYFQIEVANGRDATKNTFMEWYARLPDQDRQLIDGFIEFIYKGDLPKWFVEISTA